MVKIDPTNPADGQYVVIQNGVRITTPTPDKLEAQQEADRRNLITEENGQPVTPGNKAQVKRNLMG
jgi:hypothetical protein